MTAEHLTSSSPIEPTESEPVQTKDVHSGDENEDSGVDEHYPATSSSDEVEVETESQNKNEEMVETSCDQTIGIGEVVPIVDAVPDAPVTPAAVDTSDIDDAIRYKNLKIMYGGRDILDFCGNIANNSWHIQYTYLPEKNISMCLANRSQYHRLSGSWDAKESKLDTCRKCSFQYPVKTPDYQGMTGKKTTALDAINSNGLNDNINNNNASSMFIANQQKSLNIFNNNMNNPNNNGYQSTYPNQYNSSNNNATTMNNNTMSTSKQGNYGFHYNSNANSNTNGFMNNFNQSINNTNATNNMLNNNSKQLYAMYRQNLNNSNIANNSNNANANNYGKMPYKMYSHFY